MQLCYGKAENYQKKAEKGMKEDAKEARGKAKTEQENAIRKRGEEREELRYEPFCFGIGINALGCSLGKEIK